MRTSSAQHPPAKANASAISLGTTESSRPLTRNSACFEDLETRTPPSSPKNFLSRLGRPWSPHLAIFITRPPLAARLGSLYAEVGKADRASSRPYRLGIRIHWRPQPRTEKHSRVLGRPWEHRPSLLLGTGWIGAGTRERGEGSPHASHDAPYGPPHGPTSLPPPV